MSHHYKSFIKDKLKVRIYDSGEEIGDAAAGFTAQQLNKALQERNSANLILATGTSQFSFLEALKQKDIDWGRITVFHLDDYMGIPDSHPASFRKYLKERILDIVCPKNVNLIHGDAANLEEEIDRYEELLRNHPVDIACIGIGENGHIAFNDPPVADFNDPRLVKVVQLDEACRKQQLGEGWFPTFAEVPEEAVTLTIPAIMNCKAISCVVLDKRKSRAIHDTLNGPVSTTCPASILRNHPNAVLFLDQGSASEI
ncbi:MAG: glucosamine-6-phosphate deaminase [Bacteroidales bacterium]|nr:glucosamine-6-phosphate deaminase [Bacteroidales bacterium]